jgi:hypothetical protein
MGKPQRVFASKFSEGLSDFLDGGSYFSQYQS